MIEPEFIKAGDERVLVNGRPLQVDYRIISEDNYRQLKRSFDLHNVGVADVSKSVGCCMACKHWRYTQGRTGECMEIDKNVFTDEGHFCKNFIEGTS